MARLRGDAIIVYFADDEEGLIKKIQMTRRQYMKATCMNMGRKKKREFSAGSVEYMKELVRDGLVPVLEIRRRNI